MEESMQETSKKKKLTQKEAEKIRAEIAKKEREISGFKKEINAIGKNIAHTEEEIEDRTTTLNELKQKYAFLLQQVYTNSIKTNDQNTALFASEKQTFIYQNYLARIAEYRKSQAHSVKGNIEQLEGKKTELEEAKQATETLLKTEATARTKLQTEQEKKSREVASLTAQEHKTRKQIEEKNKAAATLNKAIQKIIEREIERAKALAEKNKPKTSTTTPAKTSGKTETYLTPQEVALSNNFESNQRRLPWPVAKGTIVSQFGKHEHPTIKGIFIENNGIDFKTPAGTPARAIFDGEVVTIFNLPTTQNCIMIKHGAFFSIYSNIENVYVKTGDKVTAKQSLGSIVTDTHDYTTKLHLEIWKGKDKLNPTTWLISAN